MHEFWWRVATTSGAQVYGLVVSSVALVLTARWLGPEGRGAVVAATAWAATFSTLGHLSLGQVAIYADDGAAAKRLNALQELLGTLILAAALIVCLSSVFAVWVVLARPAWLGALPVSLFAMGMVLLPGLMVEQYANPLLLARDRVAAFNRAQVFGRTALLAFLGLAWLSGGGPAWVLAAMGASQLVVVAVAAGVLLEEARGRLLASWARLRGLLAGGVRLHLNYVGDFLMSSAGILLVNAWSDSSQTAFYQLAIQLINILLVVPQAAALTYVPRVVSVGPEAGWAYQRSTVAALLGLMGLGAVTAGLVAPVVVPMVLGERFEPVVTAFRWLLPTVPVITLARVMSPQWLSRGLFLPIAGVTLTAGFLNVTFAPHFVAARGAVGASQALLLAYLPVLLAHGAMFVHCERLHRQSRSVGSPG